MSKNSYILLIESPDQKGLIFKVSKIIFENNLNVISNGEFVDNDSKQFFMRTEFEGEFNEESLVNQIKKSLHKNAKIEITSTSKKRIIILCTKEHHCLSDLLIRNAYNEINAEIVAVISNYDSLETLVDKFNIPYHYVTHEGKTRETHEEDMLKKIKQYNPDYIVLAKYMRILTPNFIKYYENKIINIHHSFLPAFIGANPYKQAYERGVKIIGATSHFVNNELDDGPIIMQEVIPVDHTYSANAMRQAGRDVEKMALSKALKIVFEERVFIKKNKTIIFK